MHELSLHSKSLFFYFRYLLPVLQRLRSIPFRSVQQSLRSAAPTATAAATLPRDGLASELPECALPQRSGGDEQPAIWRRLGLPGVRRCAGASSDKLCLCAHASVTGHRVYGLQTDTPAISPGQPTAALGLRHFVAGVGGPSV